jgi:hypothetical protein
MTDPAVTAKQLVDLARKHIEDQQNRIVRQRELMAKYERDDDAARLSEARRRTYRHTCSGGRAPKQEHARNRPGNRKPFAVRYGFRRATVQRQVRPNERPPTANTTLRLLPSEQRPSCSGSGLQKDHLGWRRAIWPQLVSLCRSSKLDLAGVVAFASRRPLPKHAPLRRYATGHCRAGT